MRHWLALVATLGAATCERTPPDPPRPSPTASAGDAAAPKADEPVARPAARESLVGRCVRLTPVAPPAPVPPGPDPGCPADPDGQRSGLPTTPVAFSEANSVVVEAEVVRTPQDDARGLMYRKSMGDDRGMLFDLTDRDDHKFWMHNTCIPLDMLFIDEDGLIVGIVENAPTLNDDTRSVGCPSRWVLEVNAGWSRRHGVRSGGFAVFAH